MAASKTPDVIDLTVSDHEVIELSDNSLPKPSSKKKKRRKKKKTNNSSNTVTEAEDGEILEFGSPILLGGESPATTDTQSRGNISGSRRDSSNRSSKKRKSERSPSPASDSEFFVLDAQPSRAPETQPTQQSQATTTAAPAEDKPAPAFDPSPSSDPTPGLLLPAHVSLQDANQESIAQLAAAVQTAIGDGDDDDDDFIKFLDMDSYKATGLPRYFEEEAKAAVILCTTCDEEGHSWRDCPHMICLTCGARDEHSTRSCPVSKVCFECGMKGHMRWECPNRHDSQNYSDCRRCGSGKHKTNACPTIWRIYQYVTAGERDEILRERQSRKDLPLGQGGEGYIATDTWCYNCGGSGHWGDDCDEVKHSFDTPDEPSAFGLQNASTGPFADAFASLPKTSRRRKASPMASAPGKKSKAKEKERMERQARAQEEADDVDDWFAHATKRNPGLPKRPTSQSTHQSSKKASTSGSNSNNSRRESGPSKSRSRQMSPPPSLHSRTSSSSSRHGSRLSLQDRLSDPHDGRRGSDDRYSDRYRDDRREADRYSGDGRREERNRRKWSSFQSHSGGPRYHGGYSR